MSRPHDRRRRSALTALLLAAAAGLGLLVTACVFTVPATIVDRAARGDGTGTAPALTPADRLAAENDIRATLLQGLGGLLALGGVAAGAYVSLGQVRVHREGQFIDRFTKAVEHMASDQISVRQGGIYEMEQIADVAPAYRGHIAALLTAFVRQHAPWPPTRPMAEVDAERQRFHGGLADDVGATIAVLSRRAMVEPDWWMELEKVDLRGADLPDVNLSHFCFAGANLEGANLAGANLTEARFADAVLKDADLTGAKLRDADLTGTDLTGAKLDGADLTGIQAGSTTTWPTGFHPDLQARPALRR
jgi:Pentapeptide repeats (8 copies)